VPTKQEWDEGLFTCTVWPGGSYEAHMRPEAAPHMLKAIQHMLRDTAYNTPPGALRSGLDALRTQAVNLEALAEFMAKAESAPLSPSEAAALARFRTAVMELKQQAERNGQALESLLSAVVIGARHFAQGESVSLRRSLLEAAAEITGVPMETVPVAGGRHKVSAWRPARGEVGWLPYEVTPEEWSHITPQK